METPVASGVAPDRARSWLLVPATKPETFGDAVASGVDAVILDIEDAVAPAKKPAAREAVVRWLREGNSAWVRINDATTSYWADDLAALSGLPGLVGVMLAKTESGGQVEATAARLAPGTPILALVESAMGLEAATEIARADSTFRLAFGSGDFRRDTGMSDDPLAMAYPRSRLVVSSRAARIPGPIDGPTLTANDSILGRDAALTLSMGMTGKLCMHSEQAAIVNRELAPSPTDVSWARDVIDALGADGAHVKDGSDLPRLAKALKINELAEIFGISAAS
ncbi:CoA ester lyase [Rhodococcus sp. 15-725-2-2b]|jgi:citrate lyase subunit beta/citryl-CoA lyase|uniref:HpcH/HpaI aldolase/citrate lyase family protein n=1 Tax=unclassified Rhodococcus (in: high G+C Gram-positive bacteria) TaxID=192944 RepID=UPI000B9A270B|nr:CoA ester lyase [Rhodococcus sp. 06-469-3-2]OZD42639.1 CoA ester lyase [Rhodococcus sp. 06-1477-1A]OZE06085.1 CoA ester lyase [Rhodococcus sp. 05-2255-3B1]OZE09294.1 CoA ester lyase [Rhodococcus sp. 05-2255-3C]OZE18238.1 CoA ester lyase [Rhodococcus sp. 05-2255-2A2]OZE68344.1 CoA ester lyase [Rhodococcus sp. 15-725-2-2b]OZF26748.1 CoA ester lyase [Rhodococcus sp. 14-2496-1d]